jgi:hypothetical protein
MGHGIFSLTPKAITHLAVDDSVLVRHALTKNPCYIIVDFGSDRKIFIDSLLKSFYFAQWVFDIGKVLFPALSSRVRCGPRGLQVAPQQLPRVGGPTRKGPGGNVNRSPRGDGVFGKSSPAAKAGEIHSTFDETSKTLSSRSTQVAFSANFPSFPTPSDVVTAASAEASYLLGPEVGEPIGGGDEGKWREKVRGTANTAGFGWRGGSGV